MKKIKFLHCADIHLDMPFTSLGTKGGKSSIRRQDLKDTFQNIINIARKEEVDLIFICGDLYEHDYIKKSTVDFINSIFKEIKDIKVFIIPGNHDPWVKGSYYMDFKWADNVNILNLDNPHVHLEEKRVSLYYYDTFFEYKINPNHENINIALFHGTVDFNIDGKDYNPVTCKELLDLGMDYVALGHFHNRIDDIGDKGSIYNPGSPEPLGFDELGEHGIYIGTITKTSSQGDYFSCIDINFKVLNLRWYEEIRVDITGLFSDKEIIESIVNKIEKLLLKDKGIKISQLLLNIIIDGYIEPSLFINLDHISSYFEDKVFYFKIKNETVPEYDLDLMREEPGLKGLFTQKMLNLIEGSEDVDEKKLLKKSLYYGIQALEKGQVDIIDN